MQFNAKYEERSNNVSMSVKVMKFRAVSFSLFDISTRHKRETAKHMAALSMPRKKKQLISPINKLSKLMIN